MDAKNLQKKPESLLHNCVMWADVHAFLPHPEVQRSSGLYFMFFPHLYRFKFSSSIIHGGCTT